MASTLYTVWRTAARPAAPVWALGDVSERLRRVALASDGVEPAFTRPSAAANAGPVLWSLGLLMGAAAMYLLDAENGEYRRAGVARRVEQYRDEVERTLDRQGERARRRLQGTAREARRRVRERLISDEAIWREINARLEEVLPFEEAALIDVEVRRGRAILEGAVAEDRLNRLLGRVATVPGVRGLDNRLVTRASAPS